MPPTKGTSMAIALLAIYGSVSALPQPPAYASASSNQVNLGYTTYRGTPLAAGVTQYLGMRYAAPPIGDLRWRAPEDPVQNSTVQDASAFGPLCLGSSDGLSSKNSEDCLFVNVYTPTSATSKSKLPVWVYIQGGGYAENSNANYNGTQVITASNHSILLVNFNYRVGAFGFLASDTIRQDGDLNDGLLDQRKLLHWVQKYIHLFGGDPNHVVIHGASAGAGSVSYYLTAYGGRDEKLFIGAIPESPFRPYHPRVSEVEWQFDRFVANTSCSAASDTMACLRSKSTQELQSANYIQPYPNRVNKPNFYFTPVIDGTFSTDLLYNLFEQGNMVKVPTLVGDDTNEGSSFSVNASTSEQFLEFMEDNYPTLTTSDLQHINNTYPLMSPLPRHNIWFPSASAAYGDNTFTCAGNQIAISMSRAASPQQVFNYRYNVLDAKNVAAGVGVPHTFETRAIFGAESAGNCNGCSYETYNAPVVPLVMDYFISFVKTLDPNAFMEPGSPVWQPWGSGAQDGSDGRRLRFELNATGMESVPGDQVKKCDLWRSLAKYTQQ